MNLHKISKHSPKGSVRMDTLPSFALDLEKRNHMLSFDVKGGYRHLRCSPRMRDMLMFRYNGKYYRSIAMSFGWGRSAMWFTRMMAHLVQHLRSSLGYRVLSYIDDFLLAPSPKGIIASARACRRAAVKVDAVLKDLGITRHPDNG